MTGYSRQAVLFNEANFTIQRTFEIIMYEFKVIELNDAGVGLQCRPFPSNVTGQAHVALAHIGTA